MRNPKGNRTIILMKVRQVIPKIEIPPVTLVLRIRCILLDGIIDLQYVKTLLCINLINLEKID